MCGVWTPCLELAALLTLPAVTLAGSVGLVLDWVRRQRG